MECGCTISTPIPRFAIERAVITLNEIALGAFRFDHDEICRVLSIVRAGYDTLGPRERLGGVSKGDLRRLLGRVYHLLGDDASIPPPTPDTFVTEAEAFAAFKHLQELGGYRSYTRTNSARNAAGEMELEALPGIDEAYIGDVVRNLEILTEAYRGDMSIASLTKGELRSFINSLLEGDARLHDFYIEAP